MTKITAIYYPTISNCVNDPEGSEKYYKIQCNNNKTAVDVWHNGMPM